MGEGDKTQSLAFKMLFRRKGTATTILAIALLMGLVASVNSLVNNINAETNALSKLAAVSETYLIASKNSTNLTDSTLDINTANSLRNNSDIKYLLNIKQTDATLTTKSGNYEITILGVNDIKDYLDSKNAQLNGTFSTDLTQANVGSMLSKQASIVTNQTITLATDRLAMQLSVAGITQTTTQSDSEIIVPIENVFRLTGNNQTISFIEFALKDPNTQTEAISRINNHLSPYCKIMKTQQINTFAQDISSQISSFLTTWSIAIYAIVAAASYVVATRLVTEAKYELTILRTIGARKTHSIKLILIYTSAVAFAGSALGLALGIAGIQIISTTIRWVTGNFGLAPFLEPTQAIQILLFALAFSIMGCIYPTAKAALNHKAETTL